MAIIFSEDLIRDQGKLANANIIQGAWRTVGTKSDLNALTGSTADKQKLEDGQLFWAKTDNKFYRYKVVQSGFTQTLSFEEFSFGSSSIDTSSFVTNDQTGSFIRVSQTSSMSVLSALSASFISDSFISASAARSGFGAGGSTPDGTISSSAQISALGYITSSNGDVSALNLFTGSAQTSLTALNAATSSYLTSDITSSFVLVSQTSSMNVLSALTASFISDSFISASAARSGFGSGGSTIPSGTISSSQQISDLGYITSSNADISALNTFTGSAQTSLTALNAATSSYLTSDVTASFVTISQTSSMSVLNSVTASYISPSFISASAAAAGFGSGGGSTDISALNTFTGSAQTSLTALNVATSSYITNSQTSSMSVLNALTASFISDSFISASAARSGFGSGGNVNIPSGTVSSSAQTIANLVGQNVVVNSITAETYIISSSVTYLTTLFSSGSTIFGDSLNDTHQFTGSLFVLGGVTALSFTGSLFGTSSWAVNAVNALTASYINPTFISASAAAAGFGSGGGGGSTDISALNAFTGSAQTSLTALNSATSSYITNSQTSSMLVGTASLAQTTNEVRFLGKGDNQSYYISFTNVSAGVVPYSAPLFTDNASGLAYNPSTNLIQNANLLGNVTGNLVGTASYATFAENGLSADGSISSSNWNISSDGVITLSPSSPATASAGSIYFDGTNFYFGL